MIIWISAKSKEIKNELERKIDIAITRRKIAAITVIAFTSVRREGLETVLFLAPFLTREVLGVVTGSILGVFVTSFIL
jgi:high-affinity iron transporter